MALGLAVEHVDQVGAGEQAGHPDVAAEEVVGHRHQPDVVAGQGVDQRAEHPGPVLAGQDGDRGRPRRRRPARRSDRGAR